MKFVLVVTGDYKAYNTIRLSLGPEYKVDLARDKTSSFEMFRKKNYELLFIDIVVLCGELSQNGYHDYKKDLQPFWQISSSAEIIILSSQETIREAVYAVKAGADSYLTYPINRDEVRYVTESIYEFTIMQQELDYLRGRFWQNDSLHLVQTNSPAMKKVFDKVRSVAPTRATVLLTGETGTGKSVIAKLIHRHSSRSDSQFISVHCGAIPDTLLESELFGHEKGAFTGAVRKKLGKFEIAHGGTIFLDEIGTITPAAQIKLLQVLQERSFQRVGGEKNIEVDVRIIAASNIDLKKLSNEGVFRNDLYYRLNVFPIDIPPLRDRIEDLPLLVDLFLKRLNKIYPKEIHDIHPQVMEAFEKYPWPGNIRELENLIERGFILETASILTPKSFPGELFPSETCRPEISPDISLPLAEVRHRGIEQIERYYLRNLLSAHKGRINNAARAAGVSVRQLHKLLTRYGIHKEEFR